jgi:GNAT superfamily N-acetyltransferase
LDLSIRDGDDHPFYAQYNKIDAIQHVVLAYDEGRPVGCGAVKAYDQNTMEVKRMFVPTDRRGAGIASLVLQELEAWCKEMNVKTCILETGKKQPEAIKLYRKNNYQEIPNFGPYVGVDNSLCFEKVLAN